MQSSSDAICSPVSDACSGSLLRRWMKSRLSAAWVPQSTFSCRPSLRWRGAPCARKSASAMRCLRRARCEYLRLSLGGRPHEVFVVIFLDSQNRMLGSEELFRGTLTQTSVYPREVVKTALRYNAAGVIFAHNHPSGVAEPSRADELLTQTLKQALLLVEIKTLDHFIVAGTRTVSFAERGLL
jgi:DNA repair protein RadC